MSPARIRMRPCSRSCAGPDRNPPRKRRRSSKKESNGPGHSRKDPAIVHHARRHRSIALLAISSIAIATAGGCSCQPTMSSWQKSVKKYVHDQGKGDPMVLRDMTVPEDGRPGFSVIGHHDTRESVDVNGVLLGHEKVGNRTWFVYLVGQVEKERVTDIRLAAVSMQGGKSTWKRGKGSKASLDAYRAFGEKPAQER